MQKQKQYSAMAALAGSGVRCRLGKGPKATVRAKVRERQFGKLKALAMWVGEIVEIKKSFVVGVWTFVLFLV